MKCGIDFRVYEHCTLCPRMCGVDRREKRGFCGCGDTLMAARAALHLWEEPCISGDGIDFDNDLGSRGSGTVFFTGCTLRCCFCQNFSVSSQGTGKAMTVKDLAEVFLSLQDQGAYNLNLVTPTQFLPHILEALEMIRPMLHIPVVYNCGGYERVETIDALKGYVQIYLPDIKYFSSELSGRYSQASDYFSAASRAILRMIEQVGAPVIDPESGLMKSGVLLRHMVLPGAKADSVRLVHWMKEALPEGGFLLSLLSQYTPFYQASQYPELNRRITSYEYQRVVKEAIRLGLTNGFIQEKSSAKEEYTPSFHLEGLSLNSSFLTGQ